MKTKQFDWLKSKVKSPYAPWWLGLAFTLETFLFVPLDPLLIFFSVENRSRTFFYATVATLSSVLGALGAYGLGAFMWESIGAKLVALLISQETFGAMVAYYHEYSILTVLIGGILPIPFKAITLTAGFCEIPLIPFLTCCLVARSIRFFSVASISYFWGREIKHFIDRHFKYLIFLVAVKVLIVLALLAYYKLFN